MVTAIGKQRLDSLIFERHIQDWKAGVCWSAWLSIGLQIWVW